jgi:hypothetical protein
MYDERHYLMFDHMAGGKMYALNIAGYDLNRFIPTSVRDQLHELLPAFQVLNRGSRIEIVGKVFGFRDDAVVVAAVKQVVGENVEVDFA